MRTRKIYIFLTILILVAIFLLACSPTEKEILQKLQDLDYTIGVIETNGEEKNSQLIFYDEELEYIGKESISYANVGNIFYNPVIYEKNLYLIPQGKSSSKDEKKVLQINLKNLSQKEYTIEQLAMNSICVNQKYIYTCNTLNGNSYINTCDKNSKEVKNI